MHFAVVEIDVHVDHAIASKDTIGAGAVDAFFHGGHEHAVYILADE